MICLLLGCSDYALDLHGKDAAVDPTDTDAEADSAESAETAETAAETDSTAPDACVDPALSAIEGADPWDGTVQYNPTVLWNTDERTAAYYPPIVGRMVDTNVDGVLDDADMPVVLQWAAAEPCVFEAYRGDDGTLLWTSEIGSASNGLPPVIADLDGDGWTEMVSASRELVFVHDGRDGSLKMEISTPNRKASTYDYLSVADLDGDGTGEILLGDMVLNADGSLRATLTGGVGLNWWVMAPAIADLDLDGRLEIIGGNTVYDDRGHVLVVADGVDGATGVGNLDDDPEGEVVVVNEGDVYAYDTDGTVLWARTLATLSDGPPVVADFDGDGNAEIGLPMQVGYAMLDGDGTLLWTAPTQDVSSWYTSSAAFDFDGDGADEVVYADELDVWILDGVTGTPRMQWEAHNSGTAGEYATVADVNDDGSVDILFGNSGSYGPEVGLMVISDPTWPGARGLWNQYAYMPELVTDLGAPVANPVMSWVSGDNRFHSQPRGASASPLANLTPIIADVCAIECAEDRLSVWAQIDNDGLDTVPPGFLIELWGRSESGETLLASIRSAESIGPGGRSAGFGWEIDPVPSGLVEVSLRVDVDNDVVERVETDNDVAYQDAMCP